jgi:hypothetical protein
MHFAIQPLRSPPQRNAKRTQQPTCHFCVPSPRPCTTHTKHSRKTLDTQKDTHEPSSSTRAQLDPATREKQQHTLAAYRKTQEEQALTSCTACRRAKSISSTHMQRAAQHKMYAAAHMPFLCSIAASMHNPHKAQQKDTRHSERHMNQAVVRAPNSTQQHEKQQHTLAAYRKTQEEQALTFCTARRRAKSISSTHMQRAQNIMHFAIQPLRSPPRNAKRTQQPTCHVCVPSPRACTTHTKLSRKTLDTQKALKTHMNQAVVRAPNSTQQHDKQQHTQAAYIRTINHQ